MRPRAYFRSFFTREYWQVLGALLTGMFFARQQIRDNFWNKVEEKAEERRGAD